MCLKKNVLGIVFSLAFSLVAQTSYNSLVNRSPLPPYPYATNVYLQTSDFTVPSYGPMIPAGIVCRDSGTIQVITLAGDSCKIYAKPGLNWFPIQVKRIVSAGTDAALRTSSITLYGEITDQSPYISLTTPPAPILSAPTSGSSNQPLSITLSWATGITNTTSYSVYISTGSSFSNTIGAYNTTGTYLNSVSVPSSTTLYWRACGSTAAGSGPWSSTWSFITTN